MIRDTVVIIKIIKKVNIHVAIRSLSGISFIPNQNFQTETYYQIHHPTKYNKNNASLKLVTNNIVNGGGQYESTSIRYKVQIKLCFVIDSVHSCIDFIWLWIDCYTIVSLNYCIIALLDRSDKR